MFVWCSLIRPSKRTSKLHPLEGHEGRRDGTGAVVGIGSKFLEAADLKTGEGISDFVGDSRDVMGPHQEIMFHGN